MTSLSSYAGSRRFTYAIGHRVGDHAFPVAAARTWNGLLGSCHSASIAVEDQVEAEDFHVRSSNLSEQYFPHLTHRLIGPPML